MKIKADHKIKAILDRIERIEDDISKAKEYLENGSSAHWHKFKPLFDEKIKDGEVLPPHKDWVKNVFLPGREKALRASEKLIEQIEKAK